MTPVAGALTWNGITLTRTPGQHGSGPEELAEVSREDLRAQARSAGIADARLLIPADGETLEL